MATTVTDQYSVMADVLETAVAAEFDDEEFLVVRHDRIHESLGGDGFTYVGISPTDEVSTGIDLVGGALVQFYGAHNLEVDPLQDVDPRIITNKAERMRRAVSEVRNHSTGELWFFDVERVRYPNDPTGNKTRFEMILEARGTNFALVETGD